jgi:hypothetical protein
VELAENPDLTIVVVVAAPSAEEMEGEEGVEAGPAETSVEAETTTA